MSEGCPGQLESRPHKTACPTGGRRFQVERAVLRATPPVLAADGVGTPAQPGIVWLCRHDCRHGKPGGLLHCGRPLEVERAVLRATPPVLAADGIGTPVPFGIVSLCRRDRRHGKPGGLLHQRSDWVEGRAVGQGGQGRPESRPQARMSAPHKGALEIVYAGKLLHLYILVFIPQLSKENSR